MEQQLSLLHPLTTPGAVPVWNALDPVARTETLRLLARLIAQTVVPTHEIAVDEDQERGDE